MQGPGVFLRGAAVSRRAGGAHGAGGSVTAAGSGVLVATLPLSVQSSTSFSFFPTYYLLPTTVKQEMIEINNTIY